MTRRGKKNPIAPSKQVPAADYIDPRQVVAAKADELVNHCLTLLHIECGMTEEILHGALMAVCRYYAEQVALTGQEVTTGLLYAGLGNVLKAHCIKIGDAVAAAAAPMDAEMPANWEWRGLDFYVNGEPYGFVYDEYDELAGASKHYWRLSSTESGTLAETSGAARQALMEHAKAEAPKMN